MSRNDATDTAAPPVSHRRRRPSGEPPPLPRQFDRVAVAWLVVFVFWASIWVWVFLSDQPAIWITKRDLELMRPIVERRTERLDPVMEFINSLTNNWMTAVLGWTTIIGAVITRRIRQALLVVVSLAVVAAVVSVIAARIGRPRPLGMTLTGEWSGFAQPSRPVALLATALVAASLTLVPPKKRLPVHWASAATLVVVGFAQIYTAVDHPSDVIVGATVGVAFTLTIFRTMSPEAVFPIAYGDHNTAHLDISGDRGVAIQQALTDQIGLKASEVRTVGLTSSAGSTPLRITTADGTSYFAKLYASSHLRSDRWYKLARTLLYGRLEDEERFSSVRRLVQHEDYMLHVMRRVGLPCAEPIGIAEITPEREYLLITEFLTDALEITDTEITTEIIDDAIAVVHRLWHSGLAHRDIKPANIMVQNGRIRLIDVAFGQIRPSPWRQAVDLANMMLVLALKTSPELVYERALLRFDDSEIAEAFAASRGVTLPSQLRRSVRQDGRELLGRFRSLAPARPPVAIQRWSLRRLGLTLWVTLITAVLAGIFISSLDEIGLR